MINREGEGLDDLIVPPLGVSRDVVGLGELTSICVMEIVVGGEVPNVLVSLLWLEDPQEDIDGHLLVSIWGIIQEYL